MTKRAGASGRGHPGRQGERTDPRHQLGCVGEQLAAEHLARLGFEVLERNYRTRYGELDIVAFDGSTLVFCEVKTRRSARGWSPWDKLGEPKRAQVRKMGATWLTDRPGRPYAADLRFDAIGVTIDAAGQLVALAHLEAAF